MLPLPRNLSPSQPRINGVADYLQISQNELMNHGATVGRVVNQNGRCLGGQDGYIRALFSCVIQVIKSIYSKLIHH